MSVLRTAWNTRLVYLLTLGLTLAWGIAGASVVAWMTQFVLGPYGGETDVEHALARLAELVIANPELGVGVGAGAAVTALVAWIAWTALGGVVFFAARGDALPDAVRGALNVAGPLTVQGLVHALMAGLGLVVVSVALGPLSPAMRILGLVVAAAIAVLARDLVRAQICLHGLQKPYHPRATARGFLYAFKHPPRGRDHGVPWGPEGRPRPHPRAAGGPSAGPLGRWRHPAPGCSAGPCGLLPATRLGHALDARRPRERTTPRERRVERTFRVPPRSGAAAPRPSPV